MQFIQLPTTVPVYSRIFEDPELSTVSKLIWSFLISWQLVDTIYTVLNRQTRSPNVSDERLQDESVHQPRLDWIRLSTRISKSTREIVIFTTNIIPCPLSWLNCFLKPFPFDTLNDHQSNERENFRMKRRDTKAETKRINLLCSDWSQIPILPSTKSLFIHALINSKFHYFHLSDNYFPTDLLCCPLYSVHNPLALRYYTPVPAGCVPVSCPD